MERTDMNVIISILQGNEVNDDLVKKNKKQKKQSP